MRSSVPVGVWAIVGAAIAIAVGCGLDVEATGSFDTPEAGDNEGGLITRDGGGDGTVPDPDGGIDATPDAPIDAEADRPDAGVVFAPSHILPVYTLTAGDFTVDQPTEINTDTRTIKVGAGSPIVSADIVISASDNVAVWSVGALVINDRLTIKGARALVIVAARNVDVAATISAYGDLAIPGPGGFLPATGTGKGGNGAKPNVTDASGAGGAGHATLGGAGSVQAAAAGGVAGAITSDSGPLLLGGAGGGNAGGYVAGVCADRGRGGAGGGAVQISAVGKILIASGGGIDVGGGGGSGGCKNNAMDKYSGGGGGGAGGTIVLESVTGVELESGATLEASGGGGGEGGDNNSMGVPGEAGLYPSGIAQGGSGTNGGNGGNGGVGGLTPSAPGPGTSNNTGGGGGGATGRVFLRTRGAAKLVDVGDVIAERIADPTF